MLCSNAKFRGSGLPFWPDARCGLKVVKRTLVFSAGFLGCVFQTLTLWVSDAQRRQEHGDNLPAWKSCDAAAGQQQITTYVAISLLIVGCLAAAQRFDQLAKTSYQHAHVQLGPLRSAQLFLFIPQARCPCGESAAAAIAWPCKNGDEANKSQQSSNTWLDAAHVSKLLCRASAKTTAPGFWRSRSARMPAARHGCVGFHRPPSLALTLRASSHVVRKIWRLLAFPSRFFELGATISITSDQFSMQPMRLPCVKALCV